MEALRKGLRCAAAGSTLPSFCRLLQRQLAVQGSASREQRPLATILIVGRPNVGKSTLFNRLTGGRNALVHDTPSSHVTRDYKEGLARLSDLRFRVIDTSGLEPEMSLESVQGRATRITQQVCIPCSPCPCRPNTLLQHEIAELLWSYNLSYPLQALGVCNVLKY